MRRKSKKKNINFIVGSVLITLALGLAIIGVFYTPYDPNAIDAFAKNQTPSIAHLLGTDYMGRDILSRIMDGAGTTFFVGVATVSIGVVFGSIIGALTGYFGGIVDEIIMRINDCVASFPSILLALVFVSIIGTGKYNIILALGILFIPSFARVMRSEFIKQKEMEYVKNARIMGASHGRIMFLHILPNTRAILLSSITIGFNNAILAEAGMSYLSLGVQPPDASLGRMLSEAQSYLLNAPWFAIAPGVMIVITVLGFSLISERRNSYGA